MSQSVVIPNGYLEASVGHILQSEVVPDDGLLPPWTRCPPADARLLLAPARLARKKVAAKIKHGVINGVKLTHTN